MRTKTHSDGSVSRLYELGDEVVVRSTVHNLFSGQIGSVGTITEMDRKKGQPTIIDFFYVSGPEMSGSPMVAPWGVEPTQKTISAAIEDSTI